MTWYAWVRFGGNPSPAKGPFKTVEEAKEALSRFRERYGSRAGTYENAGCIRLNVYPTRAAARDGDISDNVPSIDV